MTVHFCFIFYLTAVTENKVLSAGNYKKKKRKAL